MVTFIGNCSIYQIDKKKKTLANMKKAKTHYDVAITTTKNSNILRLYYQNI